MGESVNALGKSLAFAAGVLLCAALSSSCAADNHKTNTMASTNSVSPNSAAASESSARLAKQIQLLKELDLPDQWYDAKGDTLAERFEATAKAMHATEAQALSGKELMARFNNQGQPFFHSVWLNQPIHCPLCKTAGAQGSFTVMSVTRGLSVTISAAEWHAVTAHGQSFPAEKLAVLERMLKPQ
jgi:hypothetical protein